MRNGSWREVGYESLLITHFCLFACTVGLGRGVASGQGVHASTPSTAYTYGYQTGLQSYGQGEGDSVKRQVAHLITSVQTVMRLPLIVLNIVAIVFLVIFG